MPTLLLAAEKSNQDRNRISFFQNRISTCQSLVFSSNLLTDSENCCIFHELPGEGHAILTKDFSNEDGHPTRQTLNDIFEYFDKQLNDVR